MSDESFTGSETDASHFLTGIINSSQEDEEITAEPPTVLIVSEIFENVSTIIDDISALLNVRRSTAKLILKHFKWNKEALLREFLDASTEQLLSMANIENVATVAKVEDVDKIDESEPECEICLSTYSAEEERLVGPDECNHRFCKDCWGHYINEEIFENACDTISCAAPNCNAVLEDTVALQLIPAEKVKQKFQYLISNAYVLCNPLLRWCSAADCMFAIKVTQIEPKPVLCNCGYEFCFGCGDFWHAPITCSLLDKWKLTLGGDLLSNRWININTKKCPNCKSNIHKISGCNHMTCKSCKQEFCWICLSDWRKHKACNVWIPPEEEGKEIISAKKHEHFETRYKNHSDSFKLELLLLDKVENKLSKSEILPSDRGLYRKAIDILCKSRQTLTATYVFAYFTKKCNQLEIFEDNQRDLEVATEELADCLDRQIHPERHNDEELTSNVRPTLQDKYLYCDRRQQVLLDHVNEGYENAWWETLE